MPWVIHTSAATVATDPAVGEMVAALRTASDACLFVSGGAGRLHERHRDVVRAALEAVPLVQHVGRRLIVADGGTKAGVMELLGEIRARAADPFPLLGVLPAREVPPRGATPVDPHHSHIVAVDDPAWPSAESAWGAETAAMFTVFAQLSAGRAAVALLANGGAIALDEVARHVRAGRRVIVLAGTGRAADAIAHGLGRRGGAGGVDEADGGGGPDVVALMREVERRQILASPDAFVVVPVEDGPDALAEAMLEQFAAQAVPPPRD